MSARDIGGAAARRAAAPATIPPDTTSYPGTVSDHVFWNSPSLAAGDQILIEDSLGQVYTYRVSEVLEVYPTDLSVTGTTGGDVVSLQTCIENFGDYWTPGPNWLARYIVRRERVR